MVLGARMLGEEGGQARLGLFGGGRAGGRAAQGDHSSVCRMPSISFFVFILLPLLFFLLLFFLHFHFHFHHHLLPLLLIIRPLLPIIIIQLLLLLFLLPGFLPILNISSISFPLSLLTCVPVSHFLHWTHLSLTVYDPFYPFSLSLISYPLSLTPLPLNPILYPLPLTPYLVSLSLALIPYLESLTPYPLPRIHYS